MILKYYLIKRIFLFFDEWLFYLLLIYLYNREIYIMLPPVILYGISCIYTSYSNINRIEEKLVDIHQLIWLTDKPVFMVALNYIKNLIF